MALGLTLGIILAVSGGPVTTINQSATGCASPSASPAVSGSPAAVASASASASASPCPTASTSAGTAAAAVVPPAASFANGRTAFRQLGDVATNPVDGTGAAINLNQTAAQAAASLNCTITVPSNPLSARGLATPWQLGDGCTMTNAANEGAFVEATILSPGGQLQVYNPLVITAGTTPAATPARPTIARGSVVVIDVGFNGNNLVLQGRGARQGNCVDALGQSLIGQVSACNAVNFYRAANAAIANGALTVPALGTASDGQPCETSRSFALIDQDQSDNVVSHYLLNANGQTEQNTAANANAGTGTTTLLSNGSDDALLSLFVDPANGCTPFTAPDTTNAAGTSPSQALNELSARVNQTGTIAVVPPNDEMTLVGGAMSIAKTNVYRSLVDQPLLAANQDPAAVAQAYCQNMVNIGPARNQLDLTRDTNFGTPVAAVGTNLGSFLGARLAASFGVLGCANFGLTDPVNATVNGAGAATAVTYNLAQQTATAAAAAGGTGGAGGTATPTASPTTQPGSGVPWSVAPPRRHHHHQDGTGM